MSKPIILSMHRKEKRVEIKFKKNLDFIDLYFYLIDFLKIDIDLNGYYDEKGNINKELFLKEDELDFYKKKFIFEIFFGHKKIIVIFESNEKMQQKFIDKVTNFSEWLKPK
jgi:hypothetical protein